MTMPCRLLTALLPAFTAFVPPAAADPVADFYRGKSLQRI